MRGLHNRYSAIRLPLLPLNVVVIHAYKAHDLIPGFFIWFGSVLLQSRHETLLGRAMAQQSFEAEAPEARGVVARVAA